MKNTEELKTMKNLSVEDILKEIAKKRKEQSLLTLNVSAGKLSNVAEISKNRKAIARLQTILNEKKYASFEEMIQKEDNGVSNG